MNGPYALCLPRGTASFLRGLATLLGERVVVDPRARDSGGLRHLYRRFEMTYMDTTRTPRLCHGRDEPLPLFELRVFVPVALGASSSSSVGLARHLARAVGGGAHAAA